MDSDDYFDDSFVLDDAALNALDEAESKFSATNDTKRSFSTIDNGPAATPDTNPHPQKKPRTSAWKPPVNADDSEDLFPDVTIDSAGSYLFATDTPSIKQTNHVNGPQRVSTPRPLVTANKPLPNAARLNRPPPHNVPFKPPRPIPQQKNPTQEPSQRPTSPHVPGFTPQNSSSSPQNADSSRIADITAELDQAREEIEKLRLTLKEVEEKKMIKEGEVANLRRNIDKRNAEHAAEIARLKDVKLRVEQEKEKLQQEFKDELGRMKSRLAFKQSELESAHRRSASQFPSQTFSFTQRPNLPRMSPKKQSTQVKEPAPTFPGFQNAFERTSPVVSPTKARMMIKQRKEKEAAKTGQLMQVDETDAMFETGTVGASVPTKSSSEPPPEPESADFHDLVRVTVFTHVAPGSENFAFQHLITSSSSIDDPADAQEYQRHCRSIIETVSCIRDTDPLAFCASVVEPLTNMAKSLSQSAKTAGALAQLLSLLVVLYTMASPFREVLNTTKLTSGTAPGSHPLVIALRNAIQTLKAEDKSGEPWNPLSGLASALLQVLEASSWLGSDISSSSLPALFQYDLVLPMLLDTNNPKWFASRALAVLEVLASYQNTLSGLFLNYLLQERKKKSPHSKHKTPLAQLCAFVSDFAIIAKVDEEDMTAKLNALGVLLTLVMSSGGGVLAENLSFISSMITTLHIFTALLWEEELEILEQPSLSLKASQVINRTTCILHHLHYCSDASGSSPWVLNGLVGSLFGRERNSTIASTGVYHMFTVALGRLSYGMPPQWLEPEAKELIEGVHGLANEILESVAGGPEADLIWCAYNEPDDEDVPIANEDEELEALAIAMD